MINITQYNKQFYFLSIFYTFFIFNHLFAVSYDGSYSANFSYKMSNNSVCPEELPVTIEIDIKDKKIKGQIVNKGNPENGHAFCKLYNNGDISGEIDDNGNIIDLSIKQISSHSRKYSSYKITGSLDGESTLVSKNAKYHPPFKFNWNKVTENNIAKPIDSKQTKNDKIENKSNVQNSNFGPYDGHYFSKFSYKMRGNTCPNNLPLEIRIKVVNNIVEGFIDNIGNPENKNQYCTLYHNGEISGEIDDNGKFRKVKIKQFFNHSKKYSSHMISGTLDGDARLLSKKPAMHPSFKFKLKKVSMEKTVSSTTSNNKIRILELEKELLILEEEKANKLILLDEMKKMAAGKNVPKKDLESDIKTTEDTKTKDKQALDSIIKGEEEDIEKPKEFETVKKDAAEVDFDDGDNSSENKNTNKEKSSFGLPKIDNPIVKVPGSKSGSDLNINALADQQSVLVIQMSSALFNLMTAQQRFLEAFGLKKNAQALQSDIDNMKKGKSTPKKNFKSATKNTLEAQVLIDEKMKQGVIDAKGKIKFAQGLPSYGVGSINMLSTGFESIKLFKSLKGTKDFTILRKLGNLIFLGTNAPKLISTFTSATKTINSFTSKNEIEKPEAFKKASEEMDDEDFDDGDSSSENNVLSESKEDATTPEEASEVTKESTKKIQETIKKQDEAAEAKRKQEAAEAKRKQEAAEAKRKQKAAEAKRKQEAAEAKRKQEAAEAKRKQEAAEAKRKQEAAEARKKAEEEKRNNLISDDELDAGSNDEDFFNNLGE